MVAGSAALLSRMQQFQVLTHPAHTALFDDIEYKVKALRYACYHMYCTTLAEGGVYPLAHVPCLVSVRVPYSIGLAAFFEGSNSLLSINKYKMHSTTISFANARQLNIKRSDSTRNSKSPHQIELEWIQYYSDYHLNFMTFPVFRSHDTEPYSSKCSEQQPICLK